MQNGDKPRTSGSLVPRSTEYNQHQLIAITKLYNIYVMSQTWPTKLVQISDFAGSRMEPGNRST